MYSMILEILTFEHINAVVLIINDYTKLAYRN